MLILTELKLIDTEPLPHGHHVNNITTQERNIFCVFLIDATQCCSSQPSVGVQLNQEPTGPSSAPRPPVPSDHDAFEHSSFHSNMLLLRASHLRLRACFLYCLAKSQAHLIDIHGSVYLLVPVTP